MDLSLIKKWEGFRDRAYQCSAKKWTIGYGTTYLQSEKRSVKESDVITKEEALSELEKHVSKYIQPSLDNLESEFGEIPIALKEALASLAYNVGSSCLKSKKFKSALVNKNVEEMSAWFGMWRLVNGEVNKGLVNRRNDEIKHFENKIWL